MAMRMGEMLGFVKMKPRIKSIVSSAEFKILFLFFFFLKDNLDFIIHWIKNEI